MERFRSFWLWYTQTAMLIGIPILLILLSMGTQKLLFTATCQIAGYKCEYSIGATDAMAEYMGELLGANPGMDIVTKKR